MLTGITFDQATMLSDGGVFMLLALDDREREVVIDHYLCERTIPDVAATLGVSRDRVYQIKSGAVRKLREAAREWSAMQEGELVAA